LSTAEHRYAKLSVSTNAAKSRCKFLFGEQHIYNDMGIGYIISHSITIAQLRYMHLTRITPVTDTEQPATTSPTTPTAQLAAIH
jgi:hypothetical protein